MTALKKRRTIVLLSWPDISVLSNVAVPLPSGLT